VPSYSWAEYLPVKVSDARVIRRAVALT